MYLCKTELLEIELFWHLTGCGQKNYTYNKPNCWIRTVWLNWIAWKRKVFDNCVLMLNWIVWNRTDYSYKNGFGIK